MQNKPNEGGVSSGGGATGSTLDVPGVASIPLDEIEFEFVRSSGPGGQNVNKVSSKARLRWRPGERLAPEVWARFQPFTRLGRPKRATSSFRVKNFATRRKTKPSVSKSSAPRSKKREERRRNGFRRNRRAARFCGAWRIKSATPTRKRSAGAAISTKSEAIRIFFRLFRSFFVARLKFERRAIIMNSVRGRRETSTLILMRTRIH